MFKTNEYFDGKVMSIAFKPEDGPATVGVIAAGEYEFSTSTIEIMTVMAGKLAVLLPEKNEWADFAQFESFVVPKGTSFKVKATEDTPYLCQYK